MKSSKFISNHLKIYSLRVPQRKDREFQVLFSFISSSLSTSQFINQLKNSLLSIGSPEPPKWWVRRAIKFLGILRSHRCEIPIFVGYWKPKEKEVKA